MVDYLNIAGRVRTTASDGVAMEAQEVKDLNQNKSQQEVNADVQTELGDRYTKEETYSKEQLNAMITTPDVNYVSVVATDATTAVTDVLPVTGEANTIYRVGNWNGTQYEPTMYALFACNGTTYVCLAVRSFVGEVYDISVNHPDGQGNPTPYADLTAALGTDGANIPADIRRGGMRIQFIQGTVQSSDNKYVQYRLTSDTFTTTKSEWQKQGVDSRQSNLYKQVNIDKNNNIYHAIDEKDNEHSYLPQVFHNNLMMDNPNLTNIGNTTSVKNPFYKNVNIDKNNNIYHAIDEKDNEHSYLPQFFHNQVIFEQQPITPTAPKRLNVLVIGNSFTYDMLQYISEFLESSAYYDGISIYHITVSGGYLQFYSEIIDADDSINNHSYGGNTVKLVHKFGSTLNISANNTMREIFSQEWDVLTLCQASSYAIDYDSYKPYLCKILTTFKECCLNKSCKIAWLTSWSRGNKDDIPDIIKMLTGWQNMMAAVKLLDEDFGRIIDVYIPASTAIQNARNTTLNPVGDFTRDWHHVAVGYGEWIVGACFYQQIIYPYNGIPLWGFNYYKTISQATIDQYYNDYGTICGSVTEQNIDTLRKCVMYACVNQFEIV